MIIILEGPDGAGKTTFVHALSQSLNMLGYATFNLSGLLPEYKEQITKETSNLDKLAIMVSSFKSVIAKINNIFARNPKNCVVILDRFFPSTYAYQIYNNEDFILNPLCSKPFLTLSASLLFKEYKELSNKFYNFNKWALVYFDTDKDILLERLAKKNKDILDEYFLNDLDRIISGYKVYIDSLLDFKCENNDTLVIVNKNNDLTSEVCVANLVSTYFLNHRS